MPAGVACGGTNGDTSTENIDGSCGDGCVDGGGGGCVDGTSVGAGWVDRSGGVLDAGRDNSGTGVAV